MNVKDANGGILKRLSIIFIILLMLLVTIPSPNSVVSGSAIVNIELDTGWNLITMPRSVSASDLALKSSHITSLVRITSDGHYVSYIPSLGVMDFICEPNEEIFIHSDADTNITFTIGTLAGFISGDLFVLGNTILDRNLTVNGSMTVQGDLEANSLSVTDDLTVNGNLTVLRNLTVGGLTVTYDITINGYLTVDKDVLVNRSITIRRDATIYGNLTAGNFTVNNLMIAEDLTINGTLRVSGDAIIGGNLTVTNDIIINGNYTVTENLTVGGDLYVSGNITGLALGDMADYVIGRDATSEVYARNGRVGNIDFKSTNATEVIQSAIDAVFASDRQAGMIYLKRAEIEERYDIPLRFSVRVDYTIDTTITVPVGISIISDGALLKVTDLDDTVFELNPLGVDYGSPHLIWKIAGLAFVGHKDNLNTVAIHAYRWQYPLIIDNIHTEEVANPIKIEGTAYRTVVQNCLFIVGAGNRGEIGVHIFKGRGPYSPNGATIVNSDVSTFKTGIQIDDGYGVRINSNYFEGNDIAINSSGGTVTVVGNYIQPGYNQIGIYVYGGTVISGNGFLLGRSAEYARGVYVVRSEGSVMITGNSVATDSGNNSYLYSDVPIKAVVTGNLVGLRPGGFTSKFIDALLTGSTVSGNQINRGNPAIRQRMSPAWQENVFSDNTFFGSTIGIVTGGRDHVINNAFSAGQTDIQLNGSFNVVRGNSLRGSVARINTTGMGGSCLIENNIGFVTENSGTTATGTSIVVTHGLEGTPDLILLTPLGNTSYYHVTSIGASSFTIISEASVAFYWQAIYKP